MADTIQELLVRRALQTSPLARITQPLKLPEVKVPSLDGLSVEFPAEVASVSDEVVHLSFEQLRYSHARRSEREVGEEVGPDDEVTVEVVGYMEGEVVPYLVADQMVLGPGRDEEFPGLRAALLDHPVGKDVQVEARIPEGHPMPEFRGQLALFNVRIKAAAELTLPEIDDRDFLRAVGLGETLQQTIDSLARMLDEDNVAKLKEKATRQLLEKLAERSQVPVSEALIDHEIGRRWKEHEGRLLSSTEQHVSLRAWLANPLLREEARRGLSVSLTLRAIAQKHNITIGPKEVARHVEQLSEEQGLPLEELIASFTQMDEPQREQVTDHLTYLRTVDLVLERATVHLV